MDIDRPAVAIGKSLDDFAELYGVLPRRKLLDVVDGVEVLETDSDFRVRVLAAIVPVAGHPYCGPPESADPA